MIIYSTIDGRPVLSIGDPNYSSYFIAILISLAFLYGKRLMALFLIILGMLIISRVFVMWGLTFFGLIFFKKMLRKIPRLNGFGYLIIIVLVPILFSYIFIENVSEQSATYISDYSRLTNFTDKSNFDRALANLFYLDYVSNNPVELISGTNIDEYLMNIFYNTPHASVYATIFNYGILFLVAEICLFKLYIKSWFDNYFCYTFFISWLIWQCFLGGVLFGPQIILLAIIVNKSLTTNIKSEKRNEVSHITA